MKTIMIDIQVYNIIETEFFLNSDFEEKHILFKY
jgi:hypothetical protein